MGIRISRLALCAGFVLSALAGCASAPHLSDNSFRDLGKTEVVYVTPKPDIVVTDPAMTELAHAGKFVTLTYLTGGLFGIGGLGAAAYFAGNKFPGGMEDRVANARKVFQAQQWQERMQAAAQAAVADSRLKDASFIVMDHEPGEAELKQMVQDGGFHGVIILTSEIQMASEGDHMRMQLHTWAMSVRKLSTSCRDCNPQPSNAWEHVLTSETLESAQQLVAVDGGKTWEEQKQAGHKLHDLTEGDFAMFWMQGDPPPIKDFMDAGFQSLQAQLTVYLGGQAVIPAPLPKLQMVIDP